MWHEVSIIRREWTKSARSCPATGISVASTASGLAVMLVTRGHLVYQERFRCVKRWRPVAHSCRRRQCRGYPSGVPARPTMVFHFPQPIDDDPRVGSAERVVRMLQAFRDSGFDVELVAGSTAQRREGMRLVRRLVRAGRRVDFVYSEATTNPTAMNDAHHLPLRPLLDVRFLLFMRRHGVPVGLFYRDVHWQFDFYRVLVPPVKRWAARAFYLFDLLWYRLVLDVLFLPSRAMAEYLPGWRGSPRVVELPPAASQTGSAPAPEAGSLRLFYVGSVAPPLYDIGELVAAVATTPGVRLTICCPPDQEPLLEAAAATERITVVHEHGRALVEHYESCDIACLVYPHHRYRDFAMPIKLFEALGFARPVLVSGGREVDHFVAATKAGWVVDSHRLRDLLAELRDDPMLRRDASERAALTGSVNSWQTRAATVAAVLTAGRIGPGLDDVDRRIGGPQQSSDPPERRV